MECIDCERPLRHRNTPIADAPGTAKAQPGPRCPKCYESAPKQGKTRATECVGCERPLRPANVTLTQMPGTVVHKSHGKCATCWREQKGLTQYRRNTRPDNCDGCGRKVRPQHTTIAQYPGTVIYNSGGLCGPCYKRKRTAENRKPRPVYNKTCAGCEHPLRPKDRPESDFPGTVIHAGKGMCNSCYAHERRDTPKVRAVRLEPVPDAGLSRLIAARREREARQRAADERRARMEVARRRFIAQRMAA